MDRMEEYKALRDAPEELPPPWMAPWPARPGPGPAGGSGGGSAPRRERGGGVCRLRAPGEPVTPLRPGLRESARAQGAGRRRGLLPSLKAAVENDYMQYIGQSQTDNGITVHLEYLMADQGRLISCPSLGPGGPRSLCPGQRSPRRERKGWRAAPS